MHDPQVTARSSPRGAGAGGAGGARGTGGEKLADGEAPASLFAALREVRFSRVVPIPWRVFWRVVLGCFGVTLLSDFVG
jgi:hypothetical protein